MNLSYKDYDIKVNIPAQRVRDYYRELNMEYINKGQFPLAIRIYINASEYPTKFGHFLVVGRTHGEDVYISSKDTQQRIVIRKMKLERILK